MSIFKNLLRRNKRQNEANKLDIDTLLNAADINSSIIELDDYIADLGSAGDTLEKLTLPQKNFFFNQNLEREVNNGGFKQFFLNSSGEFANETIISLNAIKANKTAIIVQAAINQFPAGNVPKDREEREQMVQQIQDKANEIWDDLDQQFFKYEDNLNQLNIEYVKQNRNSF